MSIIRKRFRAFQNVAALWSIPWAVEGAACGLRWLLTMRHASVRFLLEFGGLLTAGGVFYGMVIGAVFGLLTFLITRARMHGLAPVTIIALLTSAFAFLVGASIEPGYNSAVIFAALALGCALISLRALWRAPMTATAGAAIDAPPPAAAL